MYSIMTYYKFVSGGFTICTGSFVSTFKASKSNRGNYFGQMK